MILKLMIKNVLLCSLLFSSYALVGMTKVKKIGKSHLFTIETLLTGYPELIGRTIAITDRERAKGFTAFPSSNLQGQVIDALKVPFGQEDIVNAERFKKTGACIKPKDAYEKLSILGYTHLVEAIVASKRNHDLEKQLLPIIYSYLEGYGFACSSTSLDFWNGALHHEGAHLLHRDPSIRIEDTLHQLKKTKKLSKRQLVEALEQTLPFHKEHCIQEYRADQEVIKRVKNPAILKAMSAYFSNLHSFETILAIGVEKTLAERIDAVFTPHPVLLTRATYFAHAAHELHKKQAGLKY